MFCRIRRKIKQSDGRNQVRLAAAKQFASTKERLYHSESQASKDEALSMPRQRKEAKEDNPRVCNGEEAFVVVKVDGLEQQTSIFKPIIGPFSYAYK